MIDQNINQIPNIELAAPEEKVGLMAQISSKIPQKIKDIFGKFYSNKKVFWPVSAAFGLLLLTIIIGVLFGSRGKTQNVKTIPSPTPITQEPTIKANQGETEIQLGKLKDQINGLDINQSRLKPPAVNFKVSF